MKNKEVNPEKFIADNWEKMNNVEIAKAIGYSEYFVRKKGIQLGLPKRASRTKEVTEMTVQSYEKGRQEKSKTNEYKKLVDTLIEERNIVRKQLEASLSLHEGLNPATIEYKVSSGDAEAVAFAIASDWHIEEEVKPHTVNGMNKFNLSVAEKRAHQFFQNTVKLLKKEQNQAKIDTLVLALLGDFISGNIHEELLETCLLQPGEASIMAENLLIGGIEFILEHTDVNLVIPCHVGNHSRVTKKIHVATEVGNSLELLIYHHIARYFASNTRVKLIMPEGYLSYVDVFGYTVCFQHGHAIKYGGGIGGLFIPAYKAISQWQKMRHADLYIFGHYHQLKDGGTFMCNGSLIGWNAYATFIKADFEQPKQLFFLVDKKRKMKTVTTPITFDC